MLRSLAFHVKLETSIIYASLKFLVAKLFFLRIIIVSMHCVTAFYVFLCSAYKKANCVRFLQQELDLMKAKQEGNFSS